MKPLLFIFVIVIIAAGGYVYLQKPSDHSSAPNAYTGSSLIATAQYVCANNQSIAAAYYKGATVASKPGQPPTPTGSVDLTLSDGRTLTLHQTISADGARYANGDPQQPKSETFVFWSKGNTALVQESGKQTAYTGCMKVAPQTADLTAVYRNSTVGYTVRYPQAWRLNIKYSNSPNGPNKPMIPGVLFRIPERMATGTNLSSYDTGLSIETLGTTTNCTADAFLGQPVQSHVMSIHGTQFSVASTTDAGAGNRYETIVYALPDSNPCLAVRYFIHYGDIHNYYPAGTVQPFDRTALMKEFNAIRDSLVIAR